VLRFRLLAAAAILIPLFAILYADVHWNAEMPGIWLVQQAGALGGAWTINVLYVVSVALTAAVTLPELKRRAMPRMEIQAGAFN